MKREISIKNLLENKKKTIENKSDSDTDCDWCTQNNREDSLKGLEDLEIKELETIHTSALLRSTWIPR